MTTYLEIPAYRITRFMELREYPDLMVHHAHLNKDNTRVVVYLGAKPALMDALPAGHSAATHRVEYAPKTRVWAHGGPPGAYL